MYIYLLVSICDVLFLFLCLLVNVGSEPFSTVLAKSVQYKYTSQADILLALTERTIGER